MRLSTVGAVTRSSLLMGMLLASTISGALCGCRGKPELASPPIDIERESAGSQQSAPPFDFQRLESSTIHAVRYQSGRDAGMHTILEIVGGGVACFDFDGDGYCDLFFPGGGKIDGQSRLVTGVASTLLRHRAGREFVDVTMESGTSAECLYTHGAVVADYDHDGFPDLLVYGYAGVCLLRNQGDGTFADVTREAGLDRAPWTTAAAWGDVDGDGELDLYLGSYVRWDFDTHQVCSAKDGTPDVCAPAAFHGSPDAFFRGTSHGVFVDATSMLQGERDGKALGIIMAKWDREPGLSIYVANDTTQNFYWRMKEDGRLHEVGLVSGVAIDALGDMNASMGVALLDFNLNQRFDILATSFEHEQIALYRNEGNHFFRYVSAQVGLNQLDARVVGFGVVAADWNGDGDEDVMVTSGHVQYHIPQGGMAQPAVILENRGGRLERRVPSCDYFDQLHVGRGLALADLNHDGVPDVVVTHLEEPPVVLLAEPPENRSWLKCRLIGTTSGRTPIGAIVTVTVGSRVMVRQLYGGGSYLSQSQPELFFGWPESEMAQVMVEWPRGQVTHLADVAPGQQLVIVEP